MEKGCILVPEGVLLIHISKFSTKQEAKIMTFLLPIEVQTSAKNFWNNGSNNYDSFSASQDTTGNVILIMENPGKVSGSRAIYFKVIDKNGKSRVYKGTYDSQGQLLHTKTKKGGKIE